VAFVDSVRKVFCNSSQRSNETVFVELLERPSTHAVCEGRVGPAVVLTRAVSAAAAVAAITPAVQREFNRNHCDCRASDASVYVRLEQGALANLWTTYRFPHGKLGRDRPDHPTMVELAGIYHNLLRRWAEV
jgi:PKHD-type hydroxylase C-terminal domain